MGYAAKGYKALSFVIFLIQLVPLHFVSLQFVSQNIISPTSLFDHPLSKSGGAQQSWFRTKMSIWPRELRGVGARGGAPPARSAKASVRTVFCARPKKLNEKK
jgi:hypothetical protein